MRYSRGEVNLAHAAAAEPWPLLLLAAASNLNNVRAAAAAAAAVLCWLSIAKHIAASVHEPLEDRRTAKGLSNASTTYTCSAVLLLLPAAGIQNRIRHICITVRSCHIICQLHDGLPLHRGMHLAQAGSQQHAVCFIRGAATMVPSKSLAMVTEHQQQRVCISTTWPCLRCQGLCSSSPQHITANRKVWL
jgi:hypothetical protein